MWTEQGLRAAAAHAHTLTHTHTTHAHTRSRPLGTSANEGGENRVCPVRIPERQARPVCGREPRHRAVRSASPSPPRAPVPSPGAGGDAGLSSPAPPATPSSRAPPGGSWQASGEQALAALAQARPGPILFPFPLRNALTRRLLKKSCRKSILSRDCPQTRLDFY